MKTLRNKLAKTWHSCTNFAAASGKRLAIVAGTAAPVLTNIGTAHAEDTFATQVAALTIDKGPMYSAALVVLGVVTAVFIVKVVIGIFRR
jgi:hypothetical protein